MLRRIAASVVQSRGIKHQVKINWVRPEYVPSYKPEKSGDLESLHKFSDDSLGLEYSMSEEIKDASETVKKLFSVAHLGRKEYHKLVRKEMMDRVRRYKYDEHTSETKIARLTAHIRYLQDNMEHFPRNVKCKQVVQELIDKRKQLLKFLRQYDYKKFEWLLEKLNIEYKGQPNTLHKLSRRESLRKLTEMHCEDVKNKKLNDYKMLLESQQGPFLKEKLEALNFIRSEQIALQLPITVNEQDIKKVEVQLAEWTGKDNIKKQMQKKKKNIAIDLD